MPIKHIVIRSCPLNSLLLPSLCLLSVSEGRHAGSSSCRRLALIARTLFISTPASAYGRWPLFPQRVHRLHAVLYLELLRTLSLFILPPSGHFMLDFHFRFLQWFVVDVSLFLFALGTFRINKYFCLSLFMRLCIHPRTCIEPLHSIRYI